jgi:hypothetical protein
MTEARGWTSLINGFASKKVKKLNPIELLPYPDEFGSLDKISEQTGKILIKLLKEGFIKPKYISALSDFIEEALEQQAKKKRS